jgi:hypothetical protein
MQTQHWKRLAAAAVLGSVSGCLAGSGVSRNGATETDDLPIVWEHAETYSNVAGPFRVVARDAATLAQLPLAEVPVDFRTHMVLVAALGPTTSDEYGIRITRVWREGNRIRADVARVHPGEVKRGGVVRASPYHIVVVPRSDLNIDGFSPAVPPKAFQMTAPPGESAAPERKPRSRR